VGPKEFGDTNPTFTSDGTSRKNATISEGSVSARWRLFTATWHKGRSEIAFYVDKALAQLVSGVTSEYFEAFVNEIRIGASTSTNAQWGKVGPYRFSSRCRDASEIAAYDLNSPLPWDEWTTARMSLGGSLEITMPSLV